MYIIIFIIDKNTEYNYYYVYTSELNGENKGNMSQNKEVKIKKIILNNDMFILDAWLVMDAQRIPGFFPIKRQPEDQYIEYVSLAAVVSLTVEADVIDNTSFGYFFCPEPKVKVI